ncbi:hypothetical protein KEM55_007885 [Ascosphaera atra]|nr:hypothetical protein KEM55_007885 [Ascosphaera atra]
MSRHPPFKEVEATRPDFDTSGSFRYTKTPDPNWKEGQGCNYLAADEKAAQPQHVEIDPYAPERPARANYTLLISGVVPRPIGFISTLSQDGQTVNLAPFSFTQVVSFDPPVLVVGISGPSPPAGKDTLRNILETKECVVNTVSEHFIEAANVTSIDTPYGMSELDLAGLHTAPSTSVKAPRIAESVFSVECKLIDSRVWHSKTDPSKVTGTTLFLEGTRFWAREDAVDEGGNKIDLAKFRPIGRAGGITYTRNASAFELPRPSYGG